MSCYTKLQTLLQYTDPLSTPFDSPRLATGPNQHITVGVLPAAGFMNGHTYFVQGLHKVRRRCLPFPRSGSQAAGPRMNS